MDIEYITKELNKKFAAPLKEYYHRRVVFWYDPDKEFSEDIKRLALDNAKVTKMYEQCQHIVLISEAYHIVLEKVRDNFHGVT